MYKHTPGPWVAVGAMVENNHAYNPDICSCDLRSFGQDNLWRTYEETAANARLIAAAPDLLQAIQDLLTMPDFDGTQPTSEIRRNAKRAARAAIAKATGEKP